MKEFFEKRRITGTISLTLSNKKKWTADKAHVCQEIVSTVTRYGRQGYKLTLRQLYYQLVASDVIPNDNVVYKKMSGILDDLRYSAKVDWDAIEDRGRVPYIPYFAEGPADAMNDIISQYRLDRMADQDNMVEVWTEKDAISGILKRVTSAYHVRLVVNKGYSSSSAMHSAYTRFAEYINDGKKVVLLYFGDHDPSGLDMIRDIRERLIFFLSKGDLIDWNERPVNDWWHNKGYTGHDLIDQGYLDEKVFDRLMDSGGTSDDDDSWEYARQAMYLSENKFTVIPIGLTQDQIDEYSPPPNPAKITDPRAKWYIEQHGPVSWEVDALRPDVMDAIVRDNILKHIDSERFEAKKEVEAGHVVKMREFAETFEN